MEPGDLNPFLSTAIEGLFWSTPVIPSLSSMPIGTLVVSISKSFRQFFDTTDVG